MTKENLQSAFTEARRQVIKAMHDYLTEQPNKTIDLPEPFIVYGKDENTYRYITIHEDPANGINDNGFNFIVGYEVEGELYAEDIDDFTMDEIYNILSCL